MQIEENTFRTVIKQDGEYFIAWSTEVAGASGQRYSVEECSENLDAAIRLILDDQQSTIDDQEDRGL